MLYCGSVSGHQLDKLAQTKLTFSPAEKINTPLLDGAVVNFECLLHPIVEMTNFDIVIGVIQKIHESTAGKLDKIYSLGGQEYGRIEKIKILQIERGQK